MSVLDPLPVSIRQLQYIVAVADLGGFRRAAEACHVAQPSLSAQIAQAERALGVQIFERNQRRVRMSLAGAAVVEQARRTLVVAGELRELARHLADPFRRTVRIGVIPTVCPYLLPDITPALSKAFPDLSVNWSEEQTAGLVRNVQEGTIDAAILALESHIGNLDYERLGRDVFVLAAAPRHPLMTTGKPVSPRVLDGETVLLLGDGHCFREQALALCGRAGASEAGFHATSLATLVQMVSAGSAVTLLPLLSVAVENRRGQLRVRPFVAPGPGRTLVFAWRRHSATREAFTKLAAVLRAAVARRMRG